MNSDEAPSSSYSEEVSSTSENCQVCGKLSAGLHYGVQSCHGCKSFFRRATLQNTQYPKCFRSETCYTNIGPGEKPKKCHKCRIKKCFSVGMVQQVLPSRKIFNPLTILPQQSSQISINKIITKEEVVCSLINQLSHLDFQIDNFRKSAYNPVFPPNLESLLQSPPQLSLAQRYGPMQGWPFTIERYLEKQNEIQKNLFSYNFGGNLIKMVDDTPHFNSNLKNWLSLDVMAAIEYAKTFNFFHKLSHKDKLILIRSTTVMNLFLTSIFQSFTMKFDELHMPDGISAAFVLDTLMNRKLANKELKMERRALVPMIRENIEKPEYLLLKAIVLCNSAVPDLSSRGQKVVDKERHKYCSALFFYCKTRFGVENGPARFYSILSMTGGLEGLQKDFRELFISIEEFIQEKMKEQNMPKATVPKMLQNELLNI